MIVDTNILIYFLEQDKARYAKVEPYFSGKTPLVITDVVLMECVYVLTKTFGRTRQQVADSLGVLLDRDNIQYGPKLAAGYLQLYKNTTLDFADCYLIALALSKNEPLKTFDKKMQKVYEQEKAKKI